MKNYEIDFCTGSIFKKIITYSLPLILSSVLQLLYNMVDIVVVGQFAGKEALAAVGSTSSLINLITNLFIGISSGSCIVVATYYGAQRYNKMSKSVHTAMTIAFISGVFLAFVGYFSSKYLLVLMGTPSDVIKLSTLYTKIYFMGMPFFMVFNFGSSILNALGDTKRPLSYLTVSGIINVVLNLIFVICFKLGVMGVAIATVVSQVISALLIVRCLINLDQPCKLDIRKLKIDKKELLYIFKNGIPAGVSRSLFSFSNVIIQSSINSLGSSVMAGSAAAANIESIIYVSMYSVAQTALTFTSQNYGAKKYDRIKKGHIVSLVYVTCVGLILGILANVFAEPLLKIFSSDKNIIPSGIIRLEYVCLLYFMCGIMDVETSVLRGMAYPIFTMIAPIICVCGVRVLWIMTVFARVKTLESIFISYPITWTLMSAISMIAYYYVMKKKTKRAI